MDLLLASQNPGKLGEMRQLVEALPLRVVSPRDVGIHESPDETGTTFLENARLKAVYYSRRSGLLTVADDSGLSVDALDGGPGLYSSRFGGEGASDADRNRLLLEKLRGVPPGRRGARFTSAVALARDGRVVFEAESSVEGRIAEEPRGASGFGYDPLFFYPPFGRTFGEVPRADKDRVSHRGQSFAKLRAFLEGLGSLASAPQPRARAVEFLPDAFVVHLEDGRSLRVPLEWFPRLRDASPEQRARYELIGPGIGIRWPELDEDISVPRLFGLSC